MNTFSFVILILGILTFSLLVVFISTVVLHTLAFVTALLLKMFNNINYKANKERNTSYYQAGNTEKVNYPKHYVSTYYNFWIINGILGIIPKRTVERLYSHRNAKNQNGSIYRLPQLFNKKSSKIPQDSFHNPNLTSEKQNVNHKQTEPYFLKGNKSSVGSFESFFELC
jgi:c-di-AMP phosphodiesterase-like protein